ncbi:hypothetical protein, partial [Staphylococcus epidermidis]|uniref:hypothetical protein n=1 Tax=Staphylococcus epidermidis TaxID=1282 RepID=UPI001C92E2CA
RGCVFGRILGEIEVLGNERNGYFLYVFWSGGKGTWNGEKKRDVYDVCIWMINLYVLNWRWVDR